MYLNIESHVFYINSKHSGPIQNQLDAIKRPMDINYIWLL